MSKIKAFLTGPKTRHAFVAAWGIATILWATNPAFKNYVWGIYNQIPHGVHEFIAGVAIPVLAYWRATRNSNSN